jgi:7-carboxy-7-deazaguanine synthase
VLLETGGHRDIRCVDPRVARIVDLKAPGSGEVDRNLWSNLDDLRPHDELKIVIADRADYDWARQVLVERRLGDRAVVHFSPVHGELDPAALAEWILEDRLPVRLQIQLHKVIWGAGARGV